MTRFSGTAKRLVVPVSLAGALIAVQVALAVAPTVSFTADPPPGGCGQFTLTSNASDGDGDIATTEWDFQTDGTFDATGSPVQTTFGTPGPRSVTLQVTDGIEADGTVDTVSATQTVEVANTGQPNAAVNTPAPVGIGDPVSFNGAGSSDGGPIAEYKWDLNNSGDFETSTGTSSAAPVQTYATPGTKTVRLEVTDSCGAADTAQASVVVQNSAPNAGFTATPNPANPGATVTFNAAPSTDPDPPDDPALTYEWSLDGDTVFNEAAEGETNAQVVTKAYPTARTLSVRLRVTDPHGATNTETIPLTINRAPFAAFSFNPEAPVINEPVTFTPTGSFDFENTIATYQWDLDGDMTSFETTGQNPPAKVYDTAGPVSVGLRVTDEDGGVTVVRRTINVQLTRPTARLTFSPANPLPGERVTLVSTSTPSATPGPPQLTNTQWDLSYQPTAEFTPDGAGPSLATSFATPGPKTVAVKVTQTGGGFDIAYVTIVVNARPVASFNVTGSLQDGADATFASTSEDPDGALVKHEWDFDKNDRYEQQGRVVTRQLKQGTHVVKLRVTDAKGATATTTRTVVVQPEDLRNPPDVQSSVSYIRRKWGIELVNFTVAVPSRTVVTVKCKGRGCPRGTFRKRSKNKKALLRFTKLKGDLRAGAKISIVFTRPGHITGWDTITIRGNNRRTVLKEQCKLGKAKKPKACPSD